jgi:dynein heavy chain
MPREMFCALPVITCKAFVSDGVPLPNAYYCPVYKTTKRGPTFVFRTNLKTCAPLDT